MKFFIFLLLIATSCASSQNKVNKVTKNDFTSQLLANLLVQEIEEFKVFNGSLCVRFYPYFLNKEVSQQDETGEVYKNYAISFFTGNSPYINNSYYEIQNLIFPQIISVIEKEYPIVEVTLEHVNHNNRKAEVFL